MSWLDYKKKFEPSKNWIISNQSSSGAIFWDEKGKCDPWDHCASLKTGGCPLTKLVKN